MSQHPSDMFTNLRLTLQDYFHQELLSRGEDIVVAYSRRDMRLTQEINGLSKWMRMNVFTNGNFRPESPAMFQVLIYTREVDDPYEIELDRLGDVVKSIFDVSSGLTLKHYGDDRTNPVVVVDPIYETDAIKLAIRYNDFDEIPPPAGTGEMLNGKAHTFLAWYWRHNTYT